MRTSLILIYMLALFGTAKAQVYVRISNTEIVEGSKTYILHTVSRNETVYSICRAYNISESELLAINPFVKKGLQAGQQLKILKKSNLTKNNAVKTTKSKSKPSVSFNYHVVEQGETFYSIAKHYGVEIKELLIANPDIENVLPAGQILRIPQFTNIEYDTKVVEPKKEDEFKTENYLIESDANNLYPMKDIEAETKIPDYCIEAPLFEDQINIVLMLPFGLSDKESDNDISRSFEFAEFYEGMIIALEKLKRMGAKIKLHVLDVASRDIEKMLSQSFFYTAHLIIGPVYPESFKVVAEFARQHNIPIVSPLALVHSSQHDNPYVYQVAMNDEYLVNMLLQYCLTDAQKSNIVFISQGGQRSDQQMQNLYQKYLPNLSSTMHQNRPARLDSIRLVALINEYERRSHQFQIQHINYQTGLLPRDNYETFLKLFTRNEVNRVIIASESEPFVAEIMASLMAFSDYYGCYIEVYAPNKWRKFENIELETFYNLNLNVAVPYFVDYQADKVIDFIKQYRTRYKVEPGQMAFQGYDVAMYFAGSIYRYGLNFEHCLPYHKEELLQSVYSFSTSPYQYHNNNGGFMLRYNPETMKASVIFP
jgi:LysM repeat protein